MPAWCFTFGLPVHELGRVYLRNSVLPGRELTKLVSTPVCIRKTLLTLCLSICLLSLGGIPPLAGFFGKIYLFWAGWQAGQYGLCCWD